MVRDQLGTEIKVGDYITYPGRHGSDLYMSIGKVTDIVEVKDWRDNSTIKLKVLANRPDYLGKYDQDVKLVTIQNINKTTVLSGKAKATAKLLLKQ